MSPIDLHALLQSRWNSAARFRRNAARGCSLDETSCSPISSTNPRHVLTRHLVHQSSQGIDFAQQTHTQTQIETFPASSHHRDIIYTAGSIHRRPKSYSLCLSLPTMSGVSRNSRRLLHFSTSESLTRLFMYFSRPSWRSLMRAGESEPKYFFGGNSGSCSYASPCNTQTQTSPALAAHVRHAIGKQVCREDPAACHRNAW